MSNTVSNTYTRTSFIRTIEGRGIAVDDPRLSASQRAAARRADLDGDGFVRGGAELSRLWAVGVDHFDKNGDASSIRAKNAAGRPTRARAEAERYELVARGAEKVAAKRPTDGEVVAHMRGTLRALDAKFPGDTAPVWAKRMKGVLQRMIADPSVRRGAHGTTLTQQDVRFGVEMRAARIRAGDKLPPVDRKTLNDGRRELTEAGSSFFESYRRYVHYSPKGDMLDYLKHANNAMQSGMNELVHQKQRQWVGYGRPWAMHDTVRQLQEDPRSIYYLYGAGDPGR